MEAGGRLRVAVIGGGSCTEAEATLAEEVGRLLAEAGAVVLTGGRGGVMAAASRGAAQAGGLVVGILPGDDASQANPWVTLPIVTGTGEARNAILMHTAQAVVAVGGEYGTLSEIAFALKFGLLVVGLHTWRASSPNQRETNRVHSKLVEAPSLRGVCAEATLAPDASAGVSSCHVGIASSSASCLETPTPGCFGGPQHDTTGVRRNGASCGGGMGQQ